MAEIETSPMIKFAQMNLPDEMESPLPLEHTDVRAQVTGPVVTVAVTQRFGNPLKETAELDYLFPLPEDAAVIDFHFTVGGRQIAGELEEAEAAQAGYTAARAEGRRAGLLEQRRPNLFAVRLANIRPGETILATLRYQGRLKFEDDAYTFVFPMGLTPKYDSPEHPSEGKGVHAPLAGASEKIGTVEIQVSVDAGVSLSGEPASPSHPIEVVRLDEKRFQLQLGGEHIPDHDFVLRYPVSGNQATAAGWVSGKGDAETFLATLLPPRLEDDARPAPREFIFVLDRSGSMMGEPIAQARNALRACLRALNPEDTVNILLFDNVLEWYRPNPVSLTQPELEQADSYLEKIQGRGGTEIVKAISAALGLPADPERTRFIVFLTDGAVSAEERALEQIRGQIGGARLFTFGIGPAVNRALLSRMAALGRGRTEFLQLNEDIEGAIIRFQDSVSFPVITDIRLEWEHAKAFDLYPAQLPDLYAGEALALSGRLARKRGVPQLTFHGKRGGQDVTLTLDLPAAPVEEPAIARVWAQARVASLLEEIAGDPSRASKLRAEIVGLALEYNLVTRYTSFVIVDQEAATAGGQPQVIHVSHPLPQGLAPDPFVAPPHMSMGMGMPLPSPAARSGPLQKAFRASAELDQGRSAPTFLTRARQVVSDQAHPQGMIQEVRPDCADLPALGDSESALRWLARTQNVDGSWNDDVEWTAAALLAFLRAGHTTRSGSFRQLVRKAMRWIAAAQPQGWGAFLRARVLAEYAGVSGGEKDRAAAQAARAALPEPKNELEAAVLDASRAAAPQSIASLDDLRLASMLRADLPLPPDLLSGPQGGLARAWAAALGQ